MRIWLKNRERNGVLPSLEAGISALYILMIRFNVNMKYGGENVQVRYPDTGPVRRDGSDGGGPSRGDGELVGGCTGGLVPEGRGAVSGSGKGRIQYGGCGAAGSLSAAAFF